MMLDARGWRGFRAGFGPAAIAAAAVVVMSVPEPMGAAPPAPTVPSSAAAVPLRAAGPPSLVIYNNDLALVREPRIASLARGVNRVSLEGVPVHLDSTSVRLEGKGLSVLSQSFHYDLWSADRVFRRFLGDSIVYRYAGRVIRGVLAGIDGDDLFIQRRDSVSVLTMVKRSQISDLEFPASRAFATRPSLAWAVESASGGEIPVTLSYLSGGIQWTAEYSAHLEEGERSVALSGWATIINRSGASYDRAKVSLVAGEVHRAGETPDRGPAALESEPAPPPSPPSDLFAYHLYALASPVDLRHLETVQVPLFQPVRVPARRGYVYDGARDGSKVRVRVEIGNEKGSGLGIPLPAGRVRVYADDPSGAGALVGEDAIGHTAAGEKVAILSGIAYDLVGERTRVSHSRVSRNVTEDRYEVRLRNRGTKPATITVVENLHGNWEITAKTAEYTKKDAESAEFEVPVAPGAGATLGYTIRFTY
jgi:hypothetical protein